MSPVVYLGDGKYQRREYAVGDRLTNPRFVGDPRYPHETFTVYKVEGEYVFTRNEYSGSEGVMPASFYDSWPAP